MRFGVHIAGPILAACALTGATAARAQDAAADPAPTVNSVIDEDPISSARAAGMGGALSTLADDMDAAFHNPAGIGGLGLNKGKSWIKKLWFPWVSASANQSSSKLMQEMRSQGASTDSTIGKALIDAHGDERQYARANAAGGMVFGRTMLVPFADLQIASTARGQGTDLLDTHYRSMSGIGYGASAQDAEGRLSIGYFGYMASRSETEGSLLYDDVIDKTKRSAALKDITQKYSGTGHNAGLVWRLGKAAAPTLGVAVKNAGDTHFKGKDGELVVKQDVTVGFSLSPQLGKTGQYSFVLEAGRLTDDEVSFLKKYKVATELLLGGIGSYATFGLRGGYNYAGPSAGLTLNLGLIGVEAAVQSIDIGVDNAKVVERRSVATFFVNVADF